MYAACNVCSQCYTNTKICTCVHTSTISILCSVSHIETQEFSAMGSSESKPSPAPAVIKEVIQKVYVNTEEADRALVQCQVENKTKELQSEVKNFKQEFPEKDVQHTVATKEDVLVLTYKDLRDTTKILDNVKDMFEGFPGTDFIVDTAKKFVMAMNSTDELKEILRWQSNKVIRNIDGQSVGVEVHYKLSILEETTKHYISKNEKDTVIMLAYKSIAHVMNTPVAEIPSWDKLKSIKF